MLKPLKILVVEDEVLIALDIEAVLRGEGWEVLGPAPDVPRALALLTDGVPDAACLDVNLKGTTSAPIAVALRARDIPFVVASGYTDAMSDPAFAGAPMVRKPFSTEELVGAIRRVLD